MERRQHVPSENRHSWLLGCAVIFLAVVVIANSVVVGLLYTDQSSNDQAEQPVPATPQVVQVPVEVPVVVAETLELGKVPVGLLNRQVLQDNLYLEGYGYDYDPSGARAITGTASNYGFVFSEPSVPDILICVEVKIAPHPLATAALGNVRTSYYYVLYRFINDWNIRSVAIEDFWRLNCNIY